MADYEVRPANPGLIVRVIEHCPIGTSITGEYCWLVESLGRPGVADAGPTPHGFIADRLLTPITPRDDADSLVVEREVLELIAA